MRYSINVPSFGEFAAPEVFADVARRAENGLADRPFDIVIGGTSPAGPAAGRDLAGPLADLGSRGGTSG